jgi:CheY-like chemotaxis protein
MSPTLKKILIVDDEKSITLLLSAILNDKYQLEYAPNSHDAILKIFEFKPDLVTVDIHMSGLKGDYLLPIIRAWQPHLPTLVITGSKDPSIQERCLENGATGYMTKPFDKDKLLQQIETTLNSEVEPPKISEGILDELELALGILERKGSITEDQAKEEVNKIKMQLKN